MKKSKDKSRIKLKVDGRLCLKCGHKWIPRGEPRMCPKCKRIRFDQEKK